MTAPLVVAARKAVGHARHSDDCSLALFNDEPCLCGLDDLREALNGLDQEQDAEGTQSDDPTAVWLATRLLGHQRLDEPRCWGISSDALAAYAVGVGPRPSIPGEPYEKSLSGGRWTAEEAGYCYPRDISDLNACERTVALAPEAMRARMLPVLDEFRSYVLDGLNRYGRPAHLGPPRPGRDEWVPWEQADG